MAEVALDANCIFDSHNKRAMKMVWISSIWGYAFLITNGNRLVVRAWENGSWSNRTIIFNIDHFGESGVPWNFDVFYEPWDPTNPNGILIHIVCYWRQDDGGGNFSWRWLYRNLDTTSDIYDPPLVNDPKDIRSGAQAGVAAADDPKFTDLAIMRTTTGKLVVGGWSGNGVFNLWRSLNGGIDWFGSGNPMPAQQFGTTILFKPMPNADPFDIDDFMVIEQWHDIPFGPGGFATRQYDDSAFRIETANPLDSAAAGSDDYLTYDASVRNSDWNIILAWLNAGDGEIRVAEIDSETLQHTNKTSPIVGNSNVRSPNVVVEHATGGAPTGRIHLFYLDLSPSPGAEVREIVSDDGGLTWSGDNKFSTIDTELRMVDVGDCLPVPQQGTDIILLPIWNDPGDQNNTSSDFAKAVVCDFPDPPAPVISVEDSKFTPIPNGGNLPWGTVIENPNPSALGIIIFNGGSADLDILVLSIGGVNPGKFAIAAGDNPSNTTVPVKSQTTCTIEADISAVGTFTAVLQIPSNDIDETPYLINLSVNVIATPANPAQLPLMQVT